MKKRMMLTGISLCLVIAGCGSNPAKTQRPDLLDNKVTAGRAEAALHRAGPDFSHVSVSANGGEVTLTGKMRTAEDKRHAKEIVRGVNRVHDVQDEIQVQP